MERQSNDSPTPLKYVGKKTKKKVVEKTVREVDSIVGLDTLVLSNKGLTSLEGLGARSNVTKLFLQNNYLTSLDYLGVLPNLCELHLQNNWLSSLKGLQPHPKLEFVNVSDNPISKHPLCRIMLLMLVGSALRKIDGENLSQIERVHAVRYPPKAKEALRLGWILEYKRKTEAEYDDIINSLKGNETPTDYNFPLFYTHPSLPLPTSPTQIAKEFILTSPDLKFNLSLPNNNNNNNNWNSSKNSHNNTSINVIPRLLLIPKATQTSEPNSAHTTLTPHSNQTQTTPKFLTPTPSQESYTSFHSETTKTTKHTTISPRSVSSTPTISPRSTKPPTPTPTPLIPLLSPSPREEKSDLEGRLDFSDKSEMSENSNPSTPHQYFSRDDVPNTAIKVTPSKSFSHSHLTTLTQNTSNNNLKSIPHSLTFEGQVIHHVNFLNGNGNNEFQKHIYEETLFESDHEREIDDVQHTIYESDEGDYLASESEVEFDEKKKLQELREKIQQLEAQLQSEMKEKLSLIDDINQKDTQIEDLTSKQSELIQMSMNSIVAQRESLKKINDFSRVDEIRFSVFVLPQGSNTYREAIFLLNENGVDIMWDENALHIGVGEPIGIELSEDIEIASFNTQLGSVIIKDHRRDMIIQMLKWWLESKMPKE